MRLRGVRRQPLAWAKGRSGLVGLGGFEPPTSPLSEVCSNQLSYRPIVRQLALGRP